MSGCADEDRDYGRYVLLEVKKPIKMRATGFVDSGNEYHSVISRAFAERLGYSKSSIVPTGSTTIGTAKAGANLRVLGELPNTVTFQFAECPEAGSFNIRPRVIEGLAMDINLSGPYLAAQKMTQDHGRDELIVQGGYKIPMKSQPPTRTFSHIYVLRDIIVPAQGIAEVAVKIPRPIDFESNVSLTVDGPAAELLGPAEKVAVSRSGQSINAIIINNGLEDKPLRRGSRIGSVQAEADKDETKMGWKDELKATLQQSSKVLPNDDAVQQALDLLTQFEDVFSLDGDFGKTHLLKHSIHTGDARPFKCGFRPVNPALEPDLRRQIDEWLKFEVIEPSTSPWCSALVAVRKKNGKIRWCIDFRNLNSVTIKDSYPLPLIEDNLARLADSRIFSAIDGSGAFHVVELDDDAKPKTAFATPWGLFQFRRMPFGLCNAPATYSRLVQLALSSIPASTCLVYLDDSLVHSNDLEQHMAGIKQVLTAYREAGLKIQPSKCAWFQSKVDYVGHTVSEAGVEPMASYLQVVKDWPLPKTIRDVRVFLGKTGYYRRFIKGYSALAGPLSDLLKTSEDEAPASPKTSIEPTADVKGAFKSLKNALLSAPILAFPRFDEESHFIVDTDWSYDNNAIGGVLLQRQDGTEKVIAYGGKKLLASQRNYSATKGELFAIIYFLRYWQYYLLWRPFTLRTDHRALTWIRTMDSPEGMVARWLETLSKFHFTVQYREGHKHADADGLSRAPHLEEIDPQEESDEGIIGLLRDDSRTRKLPRTFEEWAEEQDGDPSFRTFKDKIVSAPTMTDEEVRSLDPRTRQLWKVRDQISFRRGALFLKTKGRDNNSLVLVPQHLEDDVIRRGHEIAGHRGTEATLAVIATKAVVLGGRAAVKRIIDQCVPCQMKNDPGPGQREHYANVPTSYAFQRLSIDYVGPLKTTSRGNSYVFTVKCPFTKWVEAFPTKDSTAESAAQALTTHVFPRFGYCDEIHSDRATAFMSKLVSELCLMFGISATQTPAYHPQSNPVERAHRDLKSGIRAALEEHEDLEWDEVLPQILFAFRISPARGIGMSPYELLFGRLPNIPLGAVQAPPPRQTAILPYIEDLKENIRLANQWARDHLAAEVSRQHREYRGKRYIFRVGELVLLSDLTGVPRGESKFRRPWTGPWIIQKMATPTVAVVGRDGVNDGKSYSVAVDRLIPYYRRKKERAGERAPSPSPDPEIAPGVIDTSSVTRGASEGVQQQVEDEEEDEEVFEPVEADEDAGEIADDDEAAGGGVDAPNRDDAGDSGSTEGNQESPERIPLGRGSPDRGRSPPSTRTDQQSGSTDPTNGEKFGGRHPSREKIRERRGPDSSPTDLDSGRHRRRPGRPPDPELKVDPTFYGPAVQDGQEISKRRPTRAAAKEAMAKTKLLLTSCEKLRQDIVQHSIAAKKKKNN